MGKVKLPINYDLQVQRYNLYMNQRQAWFEEAQKNKASALTEQVVGACEEPFISEMIEANAPNRALELFNPSDLAVDLSDYSIRLFQNGQLTPLIIPLSGIMPPKSTFVIAHQAAKPEIKTKADMLDPQLSFDGNDAIVLEKTGGTQVDKIGEIGVNPGNSGWFIPPNGSTKEQTLRRKYPIDKGETNWNQGKNQWTVHPKDSVSNLKQHQNACGATGTGNEVMYSFANPEEKDTLGSSFLEFDIMVSSNNSDTYFTGGSFDIKYDTLAFGSWILTNSKITITPGTDFDITSYSFISNGVDLDADVHSFFVGTTNSPPQNRVNITPTPIPLAHYSIEISNCNQNSGLEFTNTTFTSNFNYYTLNATDTVLGSIYDSVIYENDLNIEE